MKALPEPAAAPKYITVKDVMRTYSLSKSAVYRITCAEGCPAVRIGSAVRVEADKFENYLLNIYPYIGSGKPETNKKPPKMNPVYLAGQRAKRAAKKL